jgi:ribosomal protein S27AE
MATKQQQADAAYERAEDQRALVLVLEAAGLAYDDRDPDLEAAIERVRVRFNLVNTAPTKPEPSVAGQINLLDGSIETCPKCGAPGSKWAACRNDADQEVPKLQCGECGTVVNVTWRQYEGIVAQRRRDHQHTDTVRSAVKPERESRSRGAG